MKALSVRESDSDLKRLIRFFRIKCEGVVKG